MSDNTKTLAFVVIGLLAVTVGLMSRPSFVEINEESLVGTDLTKNFDSPERAKRLRIVKFNEDTADVSKFEVAEQGGLWSIPSKDNYPADATEQMAAAATSLIGLNILEVVSHNAGDHAQFGVIDPLTPDLKVQEGVGTRITVSDDKDKPLVDLIIGKSVKDAENLRYVREAGRDVVYVVETDPTRLSTDFEDWIEKDLLKLDGWDLHEVELNDYSLKIEPVKVDGQVVGIQPRWDRQTDMKLAYDDTAQEQKWTPIKLRAFDPAKGPEGEYVDFQLAPDEELNTKALDDLRTAIDELQISDVERKPSGLSDDLKKGKDFMKNVTRLEQLASKGFIADAPSENAPLEILSMNGEVIATMKNGIEYVLRFGNVTQGPDGAGATDPAKAAIEAKDGKAADEDAGKGHVYRDLFVTAHFNESLLKQPEYEKVPELPSAAEPAASAPEAAPATPTAAEKDKAAADDKAATDQKAATEEKSDAGAEEKAKADPAAPADSAKASDTAAKVSEAKASEAKADAAPVDPAAKAERDKLVAERERIERKNADLKKTFEAQVKQGRNVVDQLNLRFSDWYFVVDDNVFQKIRLGRDQVIKKKEPPKADAAAPGQGLPPGFPGTGAVPGLPTLPGGKQ